MIRTATAILIAVAIFGSAPAQSSKSVKYSCGKRSYSVSTPLRPMCSVTFTFVGVCDGTDQVSRWQRVISTDAGGPLTGWQVGPWANTDITIVGLDLLKVSGGPSLWWMVGNAEVDDIMMLMGKDENHINTNFAIAGAGWVFPAKHKTGKATYLDLHGACTGGGPVQMALTIFYLPEVSD